jgi:hypothetical protein
MGRRVASEPQVGGAGTWLDLFYQGPTVPNLEKDPIPRDLEAPTEWVVPNRHYIQRGGGPGRMGNELRESQNQIVLNFRREGKELTPRSFSKVWPTVPRGSLNGHAFDAP